MLQTLDERINTSQFSLTRKIHSDWPNGIHGASFPIQSSQLTLNDGFRIPPAIGGWVELGRDSGASKLDVNSIADKQYYMVLVHKPSGSVAIPRLELNADTATNYNSRTSVANGADNSQTSQTEINSWGQEGNHNEFTTHWLANIQAEEKLSITRHISGSTTGTGGNPYRYQAVSKWANTSDVISRMQTGATATDSGTEMVVLGWDPADEHSTNFWTELCDVTATGSSTNLSSGTIDAKKYLWIQYFVEGTANQPEITFNNDTSGNYCRSIGTNGSADGIATAGSFYSPQAAFNTTGPRFYNALLVNVSANEKLIYGNHTNMNGTGAGNALNRYEGGGKWVNTSAQITEVDVDSSSGNWTSVSRMKIWGAD